jgi:hypothetical protein
MILEAGARGDPCPCRSWVDLQQRSRLRRARASIRESTGKRRRRSPPGTSSVAPPCTCLRCRMPPVAAACRCSCKTRRRTWFRPDIWRSDQRRRIDPSSHRSPRPYRRRCREDPGFLRAQVDRGPPIQAASTMCRRYCSRTRSRRRRHNERSRSLWHRCSAGHSRLSGDPLYRRCPAAKTRRYHRFRYPSIRPERLLPNQTVRRPILTRTPRRRLKTIPHYHLNLTCPSGCPRS